MEKSESKTKTCSPKAPKPRLRQAKELYLVEPLQLPRGPTNHFTRDAKAGHSLTVDLDGQCVTIKGFGGKGSANYTVPFTRCRYWVTDVGTATE